MMILDPYAGPRGWSEGLRRLGLTDIGVELDPSACATAVAAGHRTIRADVASFPLDHLAGRVTGLIMSPPCQAFSLAGKGDGRAVVDRLVSAVHAGDWSAVDPTRAGGYGHVLEVGRWAETLCPEWVACEQVPEALPVWQAYAQRWRAMGWSTWAGVLCAADYGVPQTRRRAFLIVSRVGRAAPPEATHAEDPHPALFGPALLPWVSMADALGWPSEVEVHHIRGAGMEERHGPRPGRRGDQPAPTVEGGSWRRWSIVTNNDSLIRRGVTRRYERDSDRPAPSVTGSARSWVWRQPATTVAGDPQITARCHHDEGTQGANAKTTAQVRAGDYEGTEPIRLTLAEALTLQGFRPDYPVQGTKSAQFLQVGNAVPPPLAAHVIAAVTGRALDLESAA